MLIGQLFLVTAVGKVINSFQLAKRSSVQAPRSEPRSNG
jgi:hypothetical protein